MDDIIVEYSGRVRMNPKNIRFEYIGRDDMPQNIDGVQWQALSEDEQDNYIIEDAIVRLRLAVSLRNDGEWIDLNQVVPQVIRIK